MIGIESTKVVSCDLTFLSSCFIMLLCVCVCVCDVHTLVTALFKGSFMSRPTDATQLNWTVELS